MKTKKQLCTLCAISLVALSITNGVVASRNPYAESVKKWWYGEQPASAPIDTSGTSPATPVEMSAEEKAREEKHRINEKLDRVRRAIDETNALSRPVEMSDKEKEDKRRVKEKLEKMSRTLNETATASQEKLEKMRERNRKQQKPVEDLSAPTAD